MFTNFNFNNKNLWIGVGVVESGGQIWVTEDFEQPKSAPSAAPAPRPAAPRPSAPHTAARPAPRPASAPHPASTPVHAAPVHAAAAAHPAAPATTVATAAPATTVPVAVLGSSTHRAAGSHGLPVPNPFTTANLTGLVALAALGASMAMFARVRVRAATQTSC